MVLCNLHNRFLITSLASTLQTCCGIGYSRILHGQHDHFCSTADSSSNSSSNSSSSSSKHESGDALKEFRQKVAALQSHQVAPDLQRWREAAAAAPPTQPSAASTSYSSSSSSSELPTDEGSSSANSLVSPHYGYAVLGGVNPEASQKEAGAQQPKLHPTRDFRQGDSYQPQDLSPLSRDEADEPWLPQRRRGRRHHHQVPAEEVKKQLDFKNVDFLLNFVSESGRLKPKRETGLKPVLQAKVARTVKLARQMALLPYDMRVGDGGDGDMWRRMRQYEAAQRAAASGSPES